MEENFKRASKGERYADDRASTIELIRKIVEYPDRRIKPIVYVMIFSGIRAGAWDYLNGGMFSRSLVTNN
jgi:hypothetical protein